jgi:fumarate reductase flavoprotein subunit
MKIIHTDVLVIGGGLAGLRTAIGAKRRGLETADPVAGAGQAFAFGRRAGRHAGQPGNGIKGEGDNEDVHFEDTVRGSDWGCDQQVARMFAHMAPKAVRELAAWGVAWNRVRAATAKW